MVQLGRPLSDGQFAGYFQLDGPHDEWQTVEAAFSIFIPVSEVLKKIPSLLAKVDK